MAIALQQISNAPTASRAAAPMLELRGVGKGFGSGAARAEVLCDVNLTVEEGEFVAIVGFSGSGKTTLMQLMAGLIAPDAGEIALQGKLVRGCGSERGLVFQNYSLLPWLTVERNILLAVNRRFPRWSRSQRRQHAGRFIEMVGLAAAARKRPSELSGGMRQRVALARTLVLKPQVLLMDEPLSALDALTRGRLQEEIVRIWESERQTCVMVTNDVDEAILMADRVVLLPPGPAAALESQFDVGLARPRHRTDLNGDPHFRHLRNEVTRCLIRMRQQARRAEPTQPQESAETLPRLEPVDVMRGMRRPWIANPSGFAVASS